MSHVFPPFDPEQPEKKGRPRPFARARDVPIRMLIPNFFTLLALCAGLTSIRMAIEQRYEIAVAAIILAALLDALDGRIARYLKASTRFGAELDSLADFVNFGVAPGIIIFTWALGDLKSIGWIAVLLFALCAALRLARFNVALDVEQPNWKGNYFVGVPAPAGAIVLLLPLYLDGLNTQLITGTAPIVLVYTAIIALLMVSQVPTFSGKLIGQKVGREYVLPVFVFTILFFAVLVTYPYATLTVGTLLYLGFIPISFLRYRQNEKEFAETEPANAREAEKTSQRAGSSNETPATKDDKAKDEQSDKPTHDAPTRPQ